ncbi:MAG: hemin uptake protein HemP [Planctomycetes bacterium]|nr:hemin uptake protein HemP [Planctomycetota bacterium]
MTSADSVDPQNEDKARPEPRAARQLESQELLRGEREVLILHSGEVYRLRLTRNGKLILQK